MLPSRGCIIREREAMMSNGVSAEFFISHFLITCRICLGDRV